MTLTPNNNTIIATNAIARNARPFARADHGVTSHPAESNSFAQAANPGATDGVGLTLSEGLRSRLAEVSQTVRSVEEANDSLQAAEGSLGEASRILLQLRDLAVQASEDEVSHEKRLAFSTQFDAGRKTIVAIAERTVIDKDTVAGALAAEEESADLEANDPKEAAEEATATASGLRGEPALRTASVDSSDSARDAIGKLDSVIRSTNNERRHIHGLQKQLETSLSSPDNAFADLQSSASTIRDADVAREVTESSRERILRQRSSDVLVNAVDASRLSLQLL